MQRSCIEIGLETRERKPRRDVKLGSRKLASDSSPDGISEDDGRHVGGWVPGAVDVQCNVRGLERQDQVVHGEIAVQSLIS